MVTDYTQPVAGMTYPISKEPVHTLYAIFDGSKDAAEATQGNANANQNDFLDTLYVGKSTDGGLTWTDSTIYSTPAGSTKELDLIFPVIGLDSAGNLYAAWTDGNLIQYAVSSNHGTTWSSPYTVNPGETGAQKTNGTADLFPWIAGGGNGRLDLVWYHGEGGDTTGYRNVGVYNTTSPMDSTRWAVAFTQLSGATATSGLAGAGTPTPTVVSRDLAVTPVIHYGNVCNNGTTCGITDAGDRTLLDFFQVAIDSHGRANIAYASDAAAHGTSTTTYTRQNCGTSVLDGSALACPAVVPLPGLVCTGDGVITDPAGDATGLALVGSSPAPSEDSLDVLKAFPTYDPATRAITFRVQVKNLGTTPDQDFRYYFSYRGTPYYLFLTRTASGMTYALDSSGATGGTVIAGGLTGAFDVAHNEARVVLPLATFNTAAKPAVPLAAGGLLTGFQVLAQRDTGAATLTADTADGACPFVVGAAAAGADPVVPEVPAAAVLPVLGLLVLGAGYGLRRRRLS